MTSQSQRLFDANVRISKMIWLPGVTAAWSDDLREFVEDDLSDAREVHRAIPWLKKCAKESGNDLETITGEFSYKRMDGFLVQFERPIPQEFHGSGYSFTWGYTQFCWFYFETLDALLDRAETWSVEVVDQARKSAKKQAKA